VMGNLPVRICFLKSLFRFMIPIGSLSFYHANHGTKHFFFGHFTSNRFNRSIGRTVSPIFLEYCTDCNIQYPGSLGPSSI